MPHVKLSDLLCRGLARTVVTRERSDADGSWRCEKMGPGERGCDFFSKAMQGKDVLKAPS